MQVPATGGRATRVLVEQIRSVDVNHVVGEPVDILIRDELAESSIQRARLTPKAARMAASGAMSQ
jgi:hypothetical protein